MNVYDQMTDYFLDLPGVDRWRELQELFKRIGSGKPKHWMLPVRVCEAVGGSIQQAVPAAVAVACSHISIILVDDLLDADPRGEYHRIGMPAAANIACALQAAGLEAVSCCEIETDLKLAALCCLNKMSLMTAQGQSWDVQNVADETDYWRVVRAKSSPFFGLALQIGALLGGESVAVASRLDELGRLYGEMIQIHDDLNDALEVPANPDWISGRSSLPILFAQVVEHPDRQRFMELRHEAFDPEKLAEAQTILIRCGAVSYGIDQLVQRYQKCREILDALPLSSPASLNGIFDEAIEPVKRLFDSLGAGQFCFPPRAPRSTAVTSGEIQPN